MHTIQLDPDPTNWTALGVRHDRCSKRVLAARQRLLFAEYQREVSEDRKRREWIPVSRLPPGDW